MNILEAYIKYNGQLIIFISGLTGCGKTKLAKKLAFDYKCKILNLLLLGS